jgi:hypothetical protein
MSGSWWNPAAPALWSGAQRDNAAPVAGGYPVPIQAWTLARQCWPITVIDHVAGGCIQDVDTGAVHG